MIWWFLAYIFSCLPSLVAQLVKKPPAMRETWVVLPFGGDLYLHKLGESLAARKL